VPRQLSHEKTELEQSVERNTKVAVRMSQNVEELQWRIRFVRGVGGTLQFLNFKSDRVLADYISLLTLFSPPPFIKCYTFTNVPCLMSSSSFPVLFCPLFSLFSLLSSTVLHFSYAA
jgi:hypothetical protein